MLDKFLTGANVKVNGEIAGSRHILRTLISFQNLLPKMREAYRVEYSLMKDAQLSHSKSWDIPLRNVKTSKEINEDLMVFR
jgi:hypothetical protein